MRQAISQPFCTSVGLSVGGGTTVSEIMTVSLARYTACFLSEQPIENSREIEMGRLSCVREEPCFITWSGG